MMKKIGKKQVDKANGDYHTKNKNQPHAP